MIEISAKVLAGLVNELASAARGKIKRSDERTGFRFELVGGAIYLSAFTMLAVPNVLASTSTTAPNDTDDDLEFSGSAIAWRFRDLVRELARDDSTIRLSPDPFSLGLILRTTDGKKRFLFLGLE